MDEDTKGTLMVVAITLVFVLLIIVGVIYLNKYAKHTDMIQDKECQRIGFDKAMVLGFRTYCLDKQIRIEVVGNCDFNNCDYAIKDSQITRKVTK